MKKTLFLSFVTIAIVVLGTIYKINVINKKRNLKAITISSEWLKNGKPVDVYKLKKGVFNNFIKVSGVKKNFRINCQVPISIKNQIKTGFWFLTESNLKGHIVFISDFANPDNGLYNVILKYELSNNEPESIVTAFINIETYKNVLSIPNNSILNQNNGSYVWKISSKKVNLTKIKTSATNFYNFTIVESGLEEGSYIVSKGIEILEENDTVNIHKEL